MLDVYLLQIRCLTETACPVWNGSLTKTDSKILESIQKTSLKVIFGHQYKSYEKSLNDLDLTTLEDRRLQICSTFAKKSSESTKFQIWFNKSKRKTKSKVKFLLPKSRTTIYKKSPLVYLTKLLNL